MKRVRLVFTVKVLYSVCISCRSTRTTIEQRATAQRMPQETMMAVPYWTNRLARPDEIDAIVDLQRTVYSDEYAETHRPYWQWRYLSQTGCRAEIVVAEFERRLIAVLPMEVYDFQWGARRLKGVMITGLVTHPDHRRRGIFRSLIASVRERTIESDAQFIMGMPNEAALPGYMRFGDWEYPGLIPLHVKVLSVPNILRSRTGGLVANLVGWLPQLFFTRRRGRIDGPPCECQLAATVPEDLDEAADEFAGECEALMIRRTAAYWNWRYGAKPDSDYHTLLARQAGRMMGAVVTSVQVRRGVRVGMIIDVVARGGSENVRRLLRAAEDDLRSRSVGLATCHATSPLLKRALREEAYRQPRRIPKKFHYVYSLSGVPGLPRQPKQMEDWHLTFGDSDNT